MIAHQVSSAGSESGAAGSPWVTLVLFSLALGSACAYLLGTAHLRRGGITWPRARDVSFTTGCAVLAVGGLVPLPLPEFSSHIAQHLLVGMLVPLFLVLGRPLTLVLRVLRPGQLRRWILAVSRAPVVSVLMFPPAAALIDIGALWLLYRTSLFSLTRDNAALHLLVHVHMLVAGILMAAAVCQLDPVRHRYGIVLRGATLVAAGAGHAVLAKTLYRSPPPGTSFASADLQQAAQLMYYGGDVVEVTIAVVVGIGWYRASVRRHLRSSRQKDYPRSYRKPSLDAPRA